MPNTFSKSVNHILRLFTSKPMAEEVDMSSRNVIVTGASPRSIGYETAKILASWGATVVVTSTHDIELMESSLKRDLRIISADEKKITAHTLDLCDVDSVNNFTTWYRKNYNDQLHVLVNNAGIHKNILSPRKTPPMTKDGFEIHWRTNFLGTFHLTSLLLPILKQSGLESGDARVVNVTSHLHDRVKNKSMVNDDGDYHSWDAYGLSKLALIHFTFEIQRRFAKKYNLQSVAVHPGSVKTNLTQIEEFEGKIGYLLNQICSTLASLVLIRPILGAQTSVMCASKYPLQGGSYYARCEIAESSGDTKDQDVSKLLWDNSDAWVKTLVKTSRDEHKQL